MVKNGLMLDVKIVIDSGLSGLQSGIQIRDSKTSSNPYALGAHARV
jgi:hypothetical protein